MNKMNYNSLPEEFIDLYTRALDTSLSLGSLSVEGYKLSGGYMTTQKTMNQYLALQYAKELIDPSKNEDRFYKYDLSDGTIDIAKLLSDEQIVDFRKIGIVVTGSKVERSPAYMINTHMVDAFDNYLYTLNDLNIKKDSIDDDEYEEKFFENEARLHIRLLHIHPFEDYNGRTMRTILTVNLLKNGYAPVIISPENKKEYISYIENDDIFGFRDFLRSESEKEEINMMELYEDFKKKEELLSKKVKRLKIS